MTFNPARPPLIRRNAQDRAPLTVEARFRNAEGLVAQNSEFLRDFVTEERGREFQLQLEALEDGEVDEETLQAEENELVAEQNEYYAQYQAHRATETARAPEGSQPFDVAVIFARIGQEYAAAEAVPPHVERTWREELAWSTRHFDFVSTILYLCYVRSILQAPVASSSSSATTPDTPRPDTPPLDTPRRPDTPRPDTMPPGPDSFQPVSPDTAWSARYTEYMRFNHYANVAPSTVPRGLALNLPAPIQEEESAFAADSENSAIAETSTITSVRSSTGIQLSTSIAVNTSAVVIDESWLENMVAQLVDHDNGWDDYVGVNYTTDP